MVGRYIPPKAIGVPGFSFPVFCRIFHDVKRQREKRIFVSWKPVGRSQTIERKEWKAFSWLPGKIKESARPLLDILTPVTASHLNVIERNQRGLWASAFKEAKQAPNPRRFDVKRSRRIATVAKGKQRVSVPTCTPELVGKCNVRSEAAVILGPGDVEGSQKCMALRDGAVFQVDKEIVNFNSIQKLRSNFAKKHARWGNRYCCCKVGACAWVRESVCGLCVCERERESACACVRACMCVFPRACV